MAVVVSVYSATFIRRLLQAGNLLHVHFRPCPVSQVMHGRQSVACTLPPVPGEPGHALTSAATLRHVEPGRINQTTFPTWDEDRSAKNPWLPRGGEAVGIGKRLEPALDIF